jgi:GT2 family glycosyltransferase
MTAPLLTVVIPFRDRSGLRALNCLRSLRWQEMPVGAIEIVVSDFGSQPAEQVAIGRACEAVSARVVRTETAAVWNRSYALNIGIREARGHYVLCTDIDMVFAPSFVPTLCAAQQAAGDRALAVCRCRDLPAELALERWEVADYPSLLARSGYRERLGTGACQMAPRSFFERVRGYDQKYVFWGMEDQDLFQRAIRAGLEPRWVHDQTSMLHQWHPSRRTERPFCKFLNDARFHLTKYRVAKNTEQWGIHP